MSSTAAVARPESHSSPPQPSSIQLQFPTEPPPASSGQGSDGLLRAPDLRGTQRPTFYENYGSSPFMEVDSDLGFSDVSDKVLNAIAAIVWSVAVWLAAMATRLFQWAFSLDLFRFVGNAVAQMVDALRSSLFAPLLPIALVLLALWAVWHGLVHRRGLLLAEGVVWSLVVLVAAGYFFANPRGVISGASNVSTGLSRGVLGAVSVVDGKAAPNDGIKADPSFSSSGADSELRVAADRWWRSFIFAPWGVMEFGDQALARQYGQRLLWTKSFTAEEQDRIARSGGYGGTYAQELEKRKEAAYSDIQSALQRDHADAFEWFAGHRGVERVGVASLTLLTVLLAGGLLIVLSGAVLLVQLALVILVVLAPLFLVLGIQPGAGRVITLRWAETMVGLLFKRVAFSAVLAVVLVVSGVLLNATYRLGWGAAMGMQILLLLVAFVYRKPFVHIFQSTALPRHSAASRTPDLEHEGRRPFQSGRMRVQGLATTAGAAALSSAGGAAAGTIFVEDEKGKRKLRLLGGSSKTKNGGSGPSSKDPEKARPSDARPGGAFIDGPSPESPHSAGSAWDRDRPEGIEPTADSEAKWRELRSRRVPRSQVSPSPREEDWTAEQAPRRGADPEP